MHYIHVSFFSSVKLRSCVRDTIPTDIPRKTYTLHLWYILEEGIYSILLIFDPLTYVMCIPFERCNLCHTLSTCSLSILHFKVVLVDRCSGQSLSSFNSWICSFEHFTWSSWVYFDVFIFFPLSRRPKRYVIVLL